MKAHVALVLALTLGGCTKADNTLVGADECQMDVPPSISCKGLMDVEIELNDCVESRFSIPLPRDVYPLPAGYENQAATQSVQVTLAHCKQGLVGNSSLEDVSMGTIGVLVTTGDHGQGPVSFNEFVLESLHSEGPLQDVFRALGFPVESTSIGIADQGILRQAQAQGDVEYAVNALLTGQQGVIANERQASHIDGRWFATERTCQYHSLTSPTSLMASKGVLVEAMPAPAPMPGSGSQAMVCSLSISFGGSPAVNALATPQPSAQRP